MQWYWHEGTQSLCHGLTQAVMKRGLPRRQMSDNGAALKAEEIRSGLARLGTLHELTSSQLRHPQVRHCASIKCW